jgi:serine/threonine-protein kinase
VQTGKSADVTPLLVADRVFWVQRDDRLIRCVDGGSGAQEWTRSSHAAPLPGVMLDGNLIVASRDGQLAALDASSGQTVWHLETGLSFSSPPAIVGDTVFIGGDRALYALRIP